MCASFRPIFDEETLIGFSQSNGHWSDLGGSVPGSFNVTAAEMFGEAVRITPIRLFHKGKFCSDVANMIAANTRDPASIIGDIHSVRHRPRRFQSERCNVSSANTVGDRCCRA